MTIMNKPFFDLTAPITGSNDYQLAYYEMMRQMEEQMEQNKNNENSSYTS